MKRINLIPKEPLFPLSIHTQKKIVYPVILTIISLYSFTFYKSYKELNNLNLVISNLKTEIDNIKKSLLEKNVYLERTTVIEKEFLTIKEDYDLLKKNMQIKHIFERLAEIVPQYMWVTSINYSDTPEKTVTISGKSFNKDAIFVFLNNCVNIGKKPELIGIDKENDNVYSFSLKIDGI